MMKQIICGLLLISFVGVPIALAASDTTDAKITDYQFASGDWYRQNGIGGNCAKITNTGYVPCTFWVQLSVEDPYGNWYYGDARPVYLQPGETSDWVCSIWDVPINAPLGWYTSEFDLGEAYNYNSGVVYNLDDSQQQPNAFYIAS